jgi:hypothetical protein
MSLLFKPVDLRQMITEKDTIKYLERLCREIAFDMPNSSTGKPATRSAIVGKIRHAIDRLDWVRSPHVADLNPLPTAADIAAGKPQAPWVYPVKHLTDEPPSEA